MKKYINWVQSTNERSSLQRIYLSLFAFSFITASITSLINYYFGRIILTFSAIFALIFVVNAICWALANSALENINSKKSSGKTTKKA